MAGLQQVVAKLEEVLADVAQCSANQSSQAYEALAQDLQDLAKMAQQVGESSVDYRGLAKKLRAGETLSTDDMAKLRLLIVGDADYYLKYDEEYDRCKTEIGKIVSEIERLKPTEFSVDGLMQLSVLCREAGGLMVLAQHYLEARDRVRHFEASTKGAISRDSAQTLAKIVEDMVARSR